MLKRRVGLNLLFGRMNTANSTLNAAYIKMSAARLSLNAPGSRTNSAYSSSKAPCSMMNLAYSSLNLPRLSLNSANSMLNLGWSEPQKGRLAPVGSAQKAVFQACLAAVLKIILVFFKNTYLR
jgi:hypothetical protein